jgi:hypothetical protein
MKRDYAFVVSFTHSIFFICEGSSALPLLSCENSIIDFTNMDVPLLVSALTSC